MARPQKSDADWFKHDKDMRNDPKILALRRRFGLEGYAVWCMTLEKLADADGFSMSENPLEMELSAGDFDVDPARLKAIWDYCVELTLLQRDILAGENSSILYSRRLNERFRSLILNREADREGFRRRKYTEESRVEERREEQREDTLSGSSDPDPVDSLIDDQKLEKDPIPHSKIVDLLNASCGSHFNAKSDATRRLIRARWNEGYRFQDFERVIVAKCAQWKRDPKMVAFLRPQTLFGTKFEGYLNEAGLAVIPCDECGVRGGHKYTCSKSLTARSGQPAQPEKQPESSAEQAAAVTAQSEPPPMDSFPDDIPEPAKDAALDIF